MRLVSAAAQPGKDFDPFLLKFFAGALTAGISGLFLCYSAFTSICKVNRLAAKYIFALVLFATFTSMCSAQTTYDWTGAVSTDWSNPANWESTTNSITTNPAATCPGSADAAQIGVLPMTNTSNFPVISTGGATSVGSIVWGTENYLNVYLTVNTTFTVNGSINNTSAVPGNGASSAYTFNISGTGTLNVTGNLNVGYDDGFSTSNPGNNNSFAFNTTLNKLNIQGSIYLNVFQGDTKHRGFVPTLNVKGGTLATTSIQSVLTNSTTYNALLNATLTVGNSSGSPAAILQLTGASSLPSFSPYVTNTITFNNPSTTIEYSGSQSQTVYTDNPVANLSNTISYNSIKFSGTGIKTALSGNLNVAGDFTNTLANDGSNYVSLSAPAVNFNGTNQNLYGGGGNGTTFYTVNCTNSGTKTMQSGIFKLASTGVLTMSGSSTQLAAGSGIFTLLSDAAGSATVAAIPSGCNVTGTVNVQRFIKGSAGSVAKRGYRLMSSTVNNGSNVSDLQYLTSYVFVSGIGRAANGFNVPTTTNPSIYLFREDCTPPPSDNSIFTTGYNWKGVASINGGISIGTQKKLTTANIADTLVSLPSANGFLLYFRGNNTPGGNGSTTGNQYTSPFNYPDDVTLVHSGTLNSGTIMVSLWYSAAASLGTTLSYSSQYTNTTTYQGKLSGGFNLVGNPYPSTINWEKYNNSAASGALTGTVSNTIWEFDELSHQYVSYIASHNSNITSEQPAGSLYTSTGTNMIASGQGFFVQASAKGQTLTFTENAKVTLPLPVHLPNMMSSPQAIATATRPAVMPSLLRLRMVLDSINSDEVLINFNSNANAKYVPGEDAIDLGGSGAMESLSVLSSDSINLAINQTPFPGVERKIIPLSVDATASQTFQLTAPEQSVPKQYQVWLKDSFTGDSVNLKQVRSYSFSIDKNNPATFGSKRLSVVINQDAAYAYRLLSFTAARVGHSYNVETHWKTTNEENYTSFIVERSNDGGKTFTVVGGLWGTGAGNYGLIDKNALTGTNLYRLKQEDVNNTITYSDLATVVITENGNKNADKIRLYPNPATSIVILDMLDKTNGINSYSITVSNNTGAIVKQAISSQPKWQIDVSALRPGTYMVRIINSKTQSFIGEAKFVKL